MPPLADRRHLLLPPSSLADKSRTRNRFIPIRQRRIGISFTIFLLPEQWPVRMARAAAELFCKPKNTTRQSKARALNKKQFHGSPGGSSRATMSKRSARCGGKRRCGG